MPNPGMGYRGTVRQAFLPDNAKGLAALAMIERCFMRGLCFRVDTSVTTGEQHHGVGHPASEDVAERRHLGPRLARRHVL